MGAHDNGDNASLPERASVPRPKRHRCFAGRLSYYRAGTTTPLETYSDALAQNQNTLVNGAIVLDGAGRLQEAVYIGSDHDAKEVLLTHLAANVAPWPDDGIPRAQVVSTAQISLSQTVWPSISLNQSNSPYTLSVNDTGKIVACSTAGGDLVINIPPAASVADGQGYIFLKETADHILNVIANGSDVIGDFGTYSISLARQSFQIVSNGVKWRVLFDTDGSPGDIKTYAASACPSGRFVCDGSAKSRTAFASLYASIGTAFGAGDGSTTFNLPEARGEFLRGWDGGRGVDTGRAFGSTQQDAFQDHTHFVASNGTANASPSAALPISYRSNQASSNNDYIFGANAGSATLGLSSGGTSIAGSGAAATETRPTNIAFLVTIKF